MLEELPGRLRAGVRVLKQVRGNGGSGVWRVRILADGPSPRDIRVEVLHALRGSVLEELTLGGFADRCAVYFEGDGFVVDQPYQERLGEGMIRCYMSGDRVAGFGHQYVTALLPPPKGTIVSPAPPPRLYYGPDKPEFQQLRTQLESKWIGQMQRLLGIERHRLPVIWDADFLLGSRTASGQDTYVLCEINVRSVFPIPDEAPATLAEAAIARAVEARRQR
jgi:hypothetical protein